VNLQAKGEENFDVLLQDGEIIDPAQGIHFAGSLAVKNGRIAALGKDLPGEAQKVIPLQGKIIAPGLIDLHCHPSRGFLWRGIPPDEVGLNSGVTLLGDGGTAGPVNFHAFRKLVVEPAATEILCFLNVAKTGLISQPEISSLRDMDVDRGKEVVKANLDCIRGIKIRVIESLAEGVGMKGMEMARRVADELKMPLMIHIGTPRERMERDRMDDFSRQAVSLLEKGDILSHYLTWEPGGLILEDGTAYPELEKARQRGVILDSCHGLWHFSFAVARHALKQGLKPDVISTDMSIPNIMVTQSLPVVMSKFLNLGLSLEEVIAMVTINPAGVLQEEEKRGSLKPGLPADITILELLKGEFLFGDGKGRGFLRGNLLLEPRMVLKAGEIRPAYSRYHIPPLYQ
jgi:dihydroorotase